MPTIALAQLCSVGDAPTQDDIHITFLTPPTVFEGNGLAVLYTGDIRSEPCHVDAITRNPCMVEYVHQQDKPGFKTLDRIYLDTSFTEDVQFQTKSEGIRELLEKVSRYPKDTVFYFSAWTYGYEEVWIALAKALNNRVHSQPCLLQVDD